MQKVFLFALAILLAPAALAGPPQLPKEYTEEVVRTLIKDIDVNANLVKLKVPYFASRKAHPCPHERGLEILKETLAAEETGSKRWLLMKSTYAFGCLHAGYGRQTEGYKTYAELFAVPASLDVQFREVLSGAMADCLSSLANPGGALQADRDAVIGILEQVADLYLRHPEVYDRDFRFPEAIGKWGLMTRTETAVKQVVAGDPDFVTLKHAAVIFKATKPKEALEFMRRAEPKRPTDKKEVASYYSLVVDLLVADKQMQEAIDTQQKLVNLTGEGQARLAQLRYDFGEKQAPADAMAAVDGATVGEKDIRELIEKTSSAKEHTAQIDLLRRYLQADRQRAQGYELWVRYTLASLLVVDNRPNEAKAALAAADTTAELNTTMARMYHRRIQQMQRQMENKVK